MNSRSRELIRQGIDPRLLHWATCLQGGKGGPPPAPDYRGAAAEQGQASIENLNQQNWANRPEQITPWGRTSWDTAAATDPSTGQAVTKWTQRQTLDPQAQQALNEQLGMQSGRSQLAGEQMGRAREEVAKPFNWGGMPAAPGSMEQAQKEAYGRAQRFQEPEVKIAREGLDQRLANQGITMGSDAYATEHRRLEDQLSRQSEQNLQGSFAEGRAQGGFQAQLRQQGIAEEAQRRGISINEMNAIISGQQVANPQMPGFSQAGVAAAPNYLGAAQSEGNYNMGANQQKQAGSQALWGDVASAAGTGAMLFAMSDERLKWNIRRIGTHHLGVGIYEYDAAWGHEVGVIAQEVQKVRPDLVARHSTGFLMVNYGGL